MKTKVNVEISESDKAKEYYRGQLNRADIDEYGFRIKVNGGNGSSSNWLNVNNDSIEVLVEFLNSLKK